MLLEEQRRIGAAQDVVIEGRDIGTVVFPEAPVKLFLTATAEVRAERRRKELIAGGEHVDVDETLQAIAARDAYDSQRAVAPLRRAADAVELDTSRLGIDQVVEAAREIVLARLGRAVKNVPLYASGDRWFYRTVRLVSGLDAGATFGCPARAPSTCRRTAPP